MSELLVFTCGHDSRLGLLRESCEAVGATLEAYSPEPWPGYVSGKLKAGVRFLQDRTEPFAMFVDGHDSLLLQPPAEIMGRLRAMGNPVLISGERNCWPDVELATQYKHDMPNKLFLNSGGYIGPRAELMTMMHYVIAEAEGEDDQRAWTKAYLAGRLPSVQIDHIRWIFASMGDGDDAVRSKSCVAHFNGRVPGREEFWQQRMAARA